MGPQHDQDSHPYSLTVVSPVFYYSAIPLFQLREEVKLWYL